MDSPGHPRAAVETGQSAHRPKSKSTGRTIAGTGRVFDGTVAKTVRGSCFVAEMESMLSVPLLQLRPSFPVHRSAHFGFAFIVEFLAFRDADLELYLTIP